MEIIDNIKYYSVEELSNLTDLKPTSIRVYVKRYNIGKKFGSALLFSEKDIEVLQSRRIYRKNEKKYEEERMNVSVENKSRNFEDFINNTVISPYEELLAYEILWTEKKASFKRLAESLSLKNILPSQVLNEQYGSLFEHELRSLVEDYLQPRLNNFSIMLKENYQYPRRLLDAKYPIDLFYYRGDLGLLDTPCISIVGTRDNTEEGERRTIKLATLLVEHNFTIVSGLAAGIDTIAMKTVMGMGAKVVGCIGTPIDSYYPKENEGLQNEVAEKHLLISQVPIYKYHIQTFQSKRFYFPQRNITMAAISDATIIIEASDTSGTLTQARACIEQGRKLFILNSCFENPEITWPAKYLKKGAVRAKNIKDIIDNLNKAA